MRELRASAVGAEAATRAALRAFAAEWPGALKELDTLPTEEIERRAAACAAGVDEPWMAWSARYHELMRAALAIRRGETVRRALRSTRSSCARSSGRVTAGSTWSSSRSSDASSRSSRARSGTPSSRPAGKHAASIGADPVLMILVWLRRRRRPNERCCSRSSSAPKRACTSTRVARASSCRRASWDRHICGSTTATASRRRSPIS